VSGLLQQTAVGLLCLNHSREQLLSCLCKSREACVC
jgi:hypothetical protein